MPLISLKPTPSPSRRLAARFAGLAFLLPFVAIAPTSAQTPAVVPLPFVTAYAVLPAGGSDRACSSSSDIPNNAGADVGDGCLPTQATIVGIYGAFTDAVGNVYI